MGYNRRDMATNFPTSLDNLTNPAGSDPVNNPSHASQHANINDAIENLEAKVGVNNSTVTTSLDYRVTQLEATPVASYTDEHARDAIALALAAGTHTNITINYNDTGNSISISAAAGYTDEEARDAIALALRGSGGITISSDDVANTITISVDNTIATKTYVDTAVSNLGSTAASTYVLDSEVGQADGIATLDGTGKVPLTQLGNLIDGAPTALNTLNELAAALGNDSSYAATITTALGNKAPIASPTFTGTVGGITKLMVGLANVDNTTDALKPVSTATQTALDLKANLASPTLTGTPAAPTATTGTNSTQIATTAFVKTEISNSVQPGAVYQTSAPSSPAVGQIWIDSDENVTTFDSNIIRRKAITATAGQTVFTADLPFIDGFEQIFMNGLLLVKTTDYATSGGNTVTLTSAAAASDVIEIVSVTGSNSIETYTQAEVNALLAANTSVAPLSISANTTLVAKKRYFVTSPLAAGTPTPVSFAVTNSGYGAYNIDGVSNGAITLTRGGTYTFNVNASGHPFYIQTTGNGYNSYNVYSSGVTGAGAQVGTVTFVVPSNAPSTLYYQCQYHPAMYGQINIIDATSSALTLTLPASPALNDEIQIVDASGNSSTYNITVARNANKINGGLNNLIIDTNGGWYTLLYTGATYGWKVG